LLGIFVALAALVQAAPAAPPAAPPTLAAPAAATETARAKVKFPPAADRRPIPFDAIRKLVVFKAKVAGREVWALLDNGSDRSLIDLEFARAAGLDVVGGRTGVARTATGGALETRVVRDVPISLDHQFETTVPIAGTDLAFITKSMGRKIDFVLGADFLKQFAVVIDHGKGVVQFGPGGAIRPGDGFIAIPITAPRGQLDVTIGGERFRVRLDTGSDGFLSVTPDAWALSKAKALRRGSVTNMGADGSKQHHDIVLAPEVQIGSLVRRNMPVALRPSNREGEDGRIGMGALSGFLIILDLKAGKLWLKPPAAQASPERVAPRE
jgi:predicted aspartyl protease